MRKLQSGFQTFECKYLFSETFEKVKRNISEV